MARDEYHYHEPILREMLPEIQNKIAPLEILTHIRNSVSSEDAQRIERRCERDGNSAGARELVNVLLRLYPDAFIKFVEAVWKGEGGTILASKLYHRVPAKYKKNLDYIFEDKDADHPLTCHKPGNHSDNRRHPQDLDDLTEEQSNSGVNQLSQQGSEEFMSAAGFQSRSDPCIDNTQFSSLPSNPFPAPNSSVEVTANAGGHNYHQSMRSQSTPLNLNVVPPPAEPFQSDSKSVPVTPSKDESFTDNSLVGMRTLSEVKRKEVVQLSKILEKNGYWEELIPPEMEMGEISSIKDTRHPFHELFVVFVRKGWTLQKFMEHAENNLDPQVYNDVCSVLGWNPPLLGAVGGMDEEPKILNKPKFYLTEDSDDRVPTQPADSPTSGRPLETSPSSQQVYGGQPATHPAQMRERTVNIVKSQYRPKNASPGQGMLLSSPSELGSRGSAGRRSAGAVVCSPSQQQSHQRESPYMHTAVGSSPELSSPANHSLLSESQGSFHAGVQTESDPDGQQAEKSSGMDADQLREDISAQSPANKYSQLSSVGLSFDGSVSSVREEKASVQPESDTQGHQAEKGPSLEAERFREDIAAVQGSTSHLAESVSVPSVEDEEGLRAEKNPDAEVIRLQEDRLAADFRNIQQGNDSTQSTGQRSATEHGGTQNSTTMTTTGSVVTTALHCPTSDAQTSATAGCEVITVPVSQRTEVLSSAASCEPTAPLNLQPAGIQSSANGATNPGHIHLEGASLAIGEHQPPLEAQTSQADCLSSALFSENESEGSGSVVGGAEPFVRQLKIGLFDSDSVIPSEEEGSNQSVAGDTRTPSAYSGDDEDSGHGDGVADGNADNVANESADDVANGDYVTWGSDVGRGMNGIRVDGGAMGSYGGSVNDSPRADDDTRVDNRYRGEAGKDCDNGEVIM